MHFHFSFSLLNKSYSFLRCLKPSYFSMSTVGKMADHLFGVNVDRGPLYFASSTVIDKLKLVAIDNDNLAASELLNGVLYNVCNMDLPKQDLLKNRIDNRFLEERLNTAELPSDAIWSSFFVRLAATDNEENSFQSGFTLKYDQSSSENDEQCTENVVGVARSLGLSSISKLVPYRQGFLVDVISCQTNNRTDHFEILPVKYSGCHPLFDYGNPAIYKSAEEIQNILHLAHQYSPLPETRHLKDLAKAYLDKPTLLSQTQEYPHPFIVIEGLDAVGKSTLVDNLGKRLNAKIFQTPPPCLARYRELLVQQNELVSRAFYSLGNYLIIEDIKEAMMKCPVVLDRYWHSTAAYGIAKEAKCGNESNIPVKGHSIYQWPDDLLKPSVVFFLVLNEKERQARMCIRGCGETNEELQLSKSQLLRERLMAAYKNMDNPACIIIDASKSREEVCDEVMASLRQNKILI